MCTGACGSWQGSGPSCSMSLGWWRVPQRLPGVQIRLDRRNKYMAVKCC